jgi:hypothetical protein
MKCPFFNYKINNKSMPVVSASRLEYNFAHTAIRDLISRYSHFQPGGSWNSEGYKGLQSEKQED